MPGSGFISDSMQTRRGRVAAHFSLALVANIPHHVQMSGEHSNLVPSVSVWTDYCQLVSNEQPALLRVIVMNSMANPASHFNSGGVIKRKH